MINIINKKDKRQYRKITLLDNIEYEKIPPIVVYSFKKITDEIGFRSVKLDYDNYEEELLHTSIYAYSGSKRLVWSTSSFINDLKTIFSYLEKIDIDVPNFKILEEYVTIIMLHEISHLLDKDYPMFSMIESEIYEMIIIEKSKSKQKMIAEEYKKLQIINQTKAWEIAEELNEKYMKLDREKFNLLRAISVKTYERIDPKHLMISRFPEIYRQII